MGAQDDWRPNAGGGLVVAQGVAALPDGDIAWRTVRGRALPVAGAAFVERPLGFVIAADGPLLLADAGSGDQVRLGRGEAAFVPAGALQQRASLSERPVGYLTIELTVSPAPPPAAGETVLEPGSPFPAPTGLRDIDLLAATIGGERAVDFPDSGLRSVLLVTDGTAVAAPPGADGATLLAGEAAGFAGPLVVTAADGANGRESTVVVAMVGPEVPAAAAPVAGIDGSGGPDAAVAPAPPAAVLAGPTPADEAGSVSAAAPVVGSISVQVFGCPAGMALESVVPGVCVPVADAAEVVLSGGGLAAPLTLADAVATESGFGWDGLPVGEYDIALAVLPDGYATWALAAPNASGDAVGGYRLAVTAEAPDVEVRIYAFPEA